MIEFSGPQSAIEAVEEAYEDDIHIPVRDGDLFVVWFSYTLGNWKALVSTHRYTGLYFEVTHNKQTDETYVDRYQKIDQVVLEDGPEDNEKEN